MSNLVLIVDDDQTTQLIIKQILTSEGYSPIICSDGLAAIEMLQVLEFQLVILDLNLPGIDGWKVLEYIKAEVHRTSVMLLTGTKDAKTLEYEASIKNDKYYSILYKPLNRDELLGKVKNLVKNSLTKNKPKTRMEF